MCGAYETNGTQSLEQRNEREKKIDDDDNGDNSNNSYSNTISIRSNAKWFVEHPPKEVCTIIEQVGYGEEDKA